MPEQFLMVEYGNVRPMRQDDADYFAKKPNGTVMRGKFSEMRNGRFFRKWWSLAKFAFEHWEFGDYEWKGQKVEPNFERFRKDLTILAGHGQPVWNIKNELRMEAKSISWGKMTEQEFEEFYSKSIDAVLKGLGHYTEQELRNVIDELVGFM